MKNWQSVVKILESFYAASGRRFPWRYTRDPYRVFVAEVMLQKTPAVRCVDAYEKFVRAFPSCLDVAKADETTISHFFEELGLRKRGRWIREACERVVMAYGGKFPASVEDLVTLKGCGTYTARAVYIAITGVGKLPVDVNVRRVLTRLYGSWKTEFEELVVSKESFYGLLDVASEFCKRDTPSCGDCPLRECCETSENIEKVNLSKLFLF